MTKIKHDYKCQNCGKPATKNIQQVWKLYDIDKNGEFDEIKEWDGDGENTFVCDKCYESGLY